MPQLSNAALAVDLRSDTVTKPTPAMFERMLNAELGDDGRGDDPTVKELNARPRFGLARSLALFLPSGTMSNQVAIFSHAHSKGEVIGEASSHIFRSEMGGLSLLAGLYPRPLPGCAGAMNIDALNTYLRAPGVTPHAIGTVVVCMETTHATTMQGAGAARARARARARRAAPRARGARAARARRRRG